MDEYTIVVDTREQLPLWTKKIERKKLDIGDYSIKGYENQIAIERKSLGDLFGTLSGGHKRFKKELMKSLGLEYFAIVIDGTYTQIQKKDFKGSYFSRMKGYVILKILFTLHVKYRINVFFASNRCESKRIIKSLFNSYINNKKKVKTSN